MRKTSQTTGKPRVARKPRAAAVTAAAGVLQLPADLGIENAGELGRQLGTVLGCDVPVTLDAAGVGRVHTAALQLFCAFFRDRGKAGHATHWHQPSETLRAAASLLGVTTLLQLPPENS